jgi:hypothetical protein
MVRRYAVLVERMHTLRPYLYLNGQPRPTEDGSVQAAIAVRLWRRI